MSEGASNYEKNKRIAGNTVFLFLRMLLMMFIGLFTSRIILSTLGQEDYGTFNAVGGVVAFCAILTGAVSSAITRFLTFSLGEGDPEKTHRVFSASLIIQVFMCLIVGVIVETAGLWWLNGHMNIPAGRMGAAHWVLHCSLGTLFVSMLSTPYNSMILAHEKMSAYAYISIFEALLKLAVALLLMWSSLDKLKTYSVLMLLVAVIVRVTYGIYCGRNFAESRGKLVIDKRIVKEMSGFVGWNFFSSGSGVLSSSGINLLANKYFGVLVNAARGVSGQVEGTLRPFGSNFLNALNPQLTKSYAEGNKMYTFDLVGKGVKIAFLLLFIFGLPLFLECDYLLDLWLKEVPEYAPLFVRVAICTILVDLGINSPRQLIISSGRIKWFCVMVGTLNILAFFATWLAFSLGASPVAPYVVLFCMQFTIDVMCLLMCKWQEGFPLGRFCKDVLLRLLVVVFAAVIPAYLVRNALPQGFLRLVLVTAASSLIIVSVSYLFVFTKGERAFVAEVFGKFISKAGRTGGQVPQDNPE